MPKYAATTIVIRADGTVANRFDGGVELTVENNTDTNGVSFLKASAPQDEPFAELQVTRVDATGKSIGLVLNGNNPFIGYGELRVSQFTGYGSALEGSIQRTSGPGIYGITIARGTATGYKSSFVKAGTGNGSNEYALERGTNFLPYNNANSTLAKDIPHNLGVIPTAVTCTAETTDSSGGQRYIILAKTATYFSVAAKADVVLNGNAAFNWIAIS